MLTSAKAGRLIAHQSVNGKYQSKLAMDSFPVLGHQMTHSLDSFITDSANSATALYTGHKSTVNALGVYVDSSKTPFDDPKVETIAEIFHRLYGGGVGIVSTAFIADATPAALTAHTRERGQYGAVIDSFLNGITNFTWTNWTGPDVLFGGGAEQFYPGKGSFQGKDYYAEFAKKNYTLVMNNTALQATSNSSKTLGIFSVSNMATWLDRNVYKKNLNKPKTAPDGSNSSATDQPGLKDMTLKALEILHTRHGEDGFFLMSEAASIDKQMHTLDYDRSLGELLELDDTIKATLKYLESIGELNDTLVLVTADHGHGFDVMGNVDTRFLNAQDTDREKRGAVGTYQESGLSQYVVANRSAPVGSDQNLVYSEGVNFPVNWDPRYTLFQGVTANPDRRENYQVHKDGPRLPALNITGFSSNDYYVNYVDAVTGFLINGTLPVSVRFPLLFLVSVGPRNCFFFCRWWCLFANSSPPSRPTKACTLSRMCRYSRKARAKRRSAASTAISTSSSAWLLALASAVLVRLLSSCAHKPARHVKKSILHKERAQLRGRSSSRPAQVNSPAIQLVK